jgi:hypothetical protein
MTTRKQWILVFALLLLLTSIGWTAAGQKKEPAKPQAWEYQYVNNPREDHINRLGAEGWEMVGFIQNQGYPKEFYFKRAK